MEALPGTIGEPIGLRVDAADSGGDRQSEGTSDDGAHSASEHERPDGSRFVAARPPEIGSRPSPIPLVSGDASALPPRPVFAPLGPVILH
jgi:hypothetical protein